jgi:uncharacterized protein YlxW (UPF0749 family)
MATITISDLQFVEELPQSLLAKAPRGRATAMQEAVNQTSRSMSDATAANAAITALTVNFQNQMQGLNATREAATQAYKQAGRANDSMYQ